MLLLYVLLALTDPRQATATAGQFIDCLNSGSYLKCERRTSDSNCRYDEYACADNNQCIPIEFICDSKPDCLDYSDEIGCAGPRIVEEPDESIIVRQGDSFSMSCRVLGKPIPNIMWMFNGRKIDPEPRLSWSSSHGLGKLTVRAAQVNDSGIWSCFAENVKNITAGRGSVVYVKQRNKLCSPPFFNDRATNQSECLRCHCFGITKHCFSGHLKVINMSLTKDISFVVVRQINDQTFTNVADLYPPNQQAIIYSPSIREFKINEQAVDPTTPNDAFYYWSLPSWFLGNQLNSYGGYLRYKFGYRVPYNPVDLDIFDVIISGNGLTLFHDSKSPHSPTSVNRVSVRFWEGYWTKNEMNLKVTYSLNQFATREEIMTTLAKLDYIYIRAGYDEVFLGSRISDVQMDSATYTGHSNLEDAALVEKCSCPEGYTGNSCESCQSGHIRHFDDQFLGKCIKLSLPCSCHGHSDKCDENTGRCLECLHNTEGFDCGRCARGYYGRATDGQPDDCLPCPCPYITPSNQLRDVSQFSPCFTSNLLQVLQSLDCWFSTEFSPTCFLDSDNDVTCNSCPIGHEGRRCEKCAPGYYGDSNSPDKPCLIVTGMVARFRQNPLSLVVLPPVPNLYMDFEIELSLNPEKTDDGLVLYSGKYPLKGDFFSLAFHNHYLEFKFELGSGVTTVRSSHPIDSGVWHTIQIIRQKKEVQLGINADPRVVGCSKGTFVGLDLRDEPLFVGAVPDFMKLQDPVGSRKGFLGCISFFKVQGIEHYLMSTPDSQKMNMESCETCRNNSCTDRGHCVEATNSQGFECLCFPGYYGTRCERNGQAID